MCGNADLILQVNKKIQFMPGDDQPTNKNALGSTLVAHSESAVKALMNAAAAGLGTLFKPIAPIVEKHRTNSRESRPFAPTRIRPFLPFCKCFSSFVSCGHIDLSGRIEVQHENTETNNHVGPRRNDHRGRPSCYDYRDVRDGVVPSGKKCRSRQTAPMSTVTSQKQRAEQVNGKSA